eukprot:comp22121_c0_seq2/m.51582 comp22121_c0_seq2/g.51582  ORF comp22121_c0_seq2/g.51582 comp22121_c0_seq2/m.51582 type:complete len:430 (+) comp22121_c0_seq2:424-1713(+)
MQCVFDLEVDFDHMHERIDSKLARAHAAGELLACWIHEQLLEVVARHGRNHGDVARVLLREQCLEAGHEPREHAELGKLLEPERDFLHHELLEHTDKLGKPAHSRVLALEEHQDMRIDLRNNETVDIEELREPRHRQIALDAAVGPLDLGRVVGHDSSFLVLGHELDGGIDARDRTACAGGGPDEHVGCGEIVEQARVLEVACGRDGDVDDASCLFECLLECEIAHVGLCPLLELADIHDHAVVDEALDAALHCARGFGLQTVKDIEIDAVDVEVARKFLVCCGCKKSCNESADGGARDHAREQLGLEEGLDHAEVVHSKRAAAREQEGRSSICMPGVLEDKVFLLEGESLEILLAEPFELEADFVDVFLDQLLCADRCAVVELLVSDSTNVAQQAGPQQPHECAVVLSVRSSAQHFQPLRNQHMVVEI